MFTEADLKKLGQLVIGVRNALTDFAASEEGKALVRWAIGTQSPEDDPRRLLVLSGRQEHVEHYLRVMARAGWYLDPSWHGGTEHFLARHIEEGAPDEADEVICDVVEEKAASSLTRLEGDYPLRARFFRAAFSAHERKEYALSIPLMLAQADGICWEHVGVQLHARDRNSGAPKLAQVLAKDGDPFMAYLSPLVEVHPVAFNAVERKTVAPDLVKLNRHAVLHGESLDYDTRANACRAMSYLRFVGWAIKQAAKPQAP